MNQQSGKSIKRQAFWEVYDRRCAYCGEPKSFGEIQIDHIIPQKYKQSKYFQQWNNLKAQCGLSDNFDLENYENLLPSCDVCNQKRKKDNVYEVPRIITLLEYAKPKIIKVQTKEMNLKLSIDQDKAIATLRAKQESGDLSTDTFNQLKEIMERETGKKILYLPKLDILEIGKTTYYQVNSLIERLDNSGQIRLKQICRLTLNKCQDAYLVDYAISTNIILLLGISLFNDPVNYKLTLGIIGITLIITDDNLNNIFFNTGKNLQEQYWLLNDKINRMLYNLLINLQYVTN